MTSTTSGLTDGEATRDPMAALATRSVAVMASGTRDDFDDVYHPEFRNREASAEPPETRGRGPAAAWATAQWLRGSYADLSWAIGDVLVRDELVVVSATMSGRHAGPVTFYDADGGVERVFPPTGREFAVEQVHFCRLSAGLVIEHWAVRDDLGQATQLGWIPPTPGYLWRCARATRRARRAHR